MLNRIDTYSGKTFSLYLRQPRQSLNLGFTTLPFLHWVIGLFEFEALFQNKDSQRDTMERNIIFIIYHKIQNYSIWTSSFFCKGLGIHRGGFCRYEIEYIFFGPGLPIFQSKTNLLI